MIGLGQFFLSFLQSIFIYHAVNLINVRLHSYIESFYNDIILNQNIFAIVSLQYSYNSLRKI